MLLPEIPLQPRGRGQLSAMCLTVRAAIAWRTLVRPSLVLAAIGGLCAAPVSAESVPQTLPYAGKPAAAQLEVLAPWIGDWSLDIEVAPNAGAPDGVRFTGSATGRRLLNGQFIRVDGQTSNGKTREEYFILYAFDAGKSLYRRWYFSSIGLVSEFEGRWDQAKREMTWTLLNATGNQSATIVYAIAPDRITTHVTYRGADGKIARSAINRATRKPS